MRKPWFLFTCLVFGYAFLYVPIILLMIYSFNASRLVTIWGGFSFKWYGTLLDNEQMMDAARRSLEIAAAPSPGWCWPGSAGSAAAPCSPAWSRHRWSCPR
jgi:putrescine transport system permease protein